MSVWRRRQVAAATATEDGAAIGRQELQAIIEHARWLLEYHNKRNEAVGQRAVAVLGFTGVIIALVPATLALQNHLRVTTWLWVSIGVTLAALLATAGLSLLTLTTRTTGGPAIRQAREILGMHTRGTRRGRVHVDVAHGFLHGLDLSQKSPVDLAYDEANSRARTFRWSLRALVVALLALASLVVQVVHQGGGEVTHERARTGGHSTGEHNNAVRGDGRSAAADRLLREERRPLEGRNSRSARPLILPQ